MPGTRHRNSASEPNHVFTKPRRRSPPWLSGSGQSRHGILGGGAAATGPHRRDDRYSRGPDESIAARLISRQPLVVGFSLIFQVFFRSSERVASCLRDVGIKSHFTIGGHFPACATMKCSPISLNSTAWCGTKARRRWSTSSNDSRAGNDWRETPGIAFLTDGQVAVTEPRALV